MNIFKCWEYQVLVKTRKRRGDLMCDTGSSMWTVSSMGQPWCLAGQSFHCLECISPGYHQSYGMVGPSLERSMRSLRLIKKQSWRLWLSINKYTLSPWGFSLLIQTELRPHIPPSTFSAFPCSPPPFLCVSWQYSETPSTRTPNGHTQWHRSVPCLVRKRLLAVNGN